MFDVSKFAVSLLNAETERGKQRSIGPSQIGDPCTKHLAYALLNKEEEPSKYWLGAVIGTAIHAMLEDRVSGREETLIEQKVSIGELQGYGKINGNADLVLLDQKLLIDWKTSSRAKVKKYSDFVYGVKDSEASRYTMQKYVAQVQLYAWGLVQAGYEIEKIAVCFINRDGTNENDIWTYTLDYDQGFAKAIWARLESVWEQLQSGKSPDDFDSHSECFKCKIGI